LGLAQTNRGELYERGEGVSRDCRRAVHWYRLAALQESRRAQARLTVLLGRMAMAAE
jgi:TPR repeat protein